MVYKFFDKKSASLTDKSVSRSGVNILLEFNEELAEELHKNQLIKNFKKEKFILSLEIIFGCWFSWYAINKQV